MNIEEVSTDEQRISMQESSPQGSLGAIDHHQLTMPHSIQLEIVTPTRVIDCGQVTYLRAPSSDGLFGILGGHTRAMIALDTGPVNVTAQGQTRTFATNGGYADIRGESVQLLVETAEEAAEIDTPRAESAARRARERLRQKARDKLMDETRARAALERALVRLAVGGGSG